MQNQKSDGVLVGDLSEMRISTMDEADYRLFDSFGKLLTTCSTVVRHAR